MSCNPSGLPGRCRACPDSEKLKPTKSPRIPNVALRSLQERSGAVKHDPYGSWFVIIINMYHVYILQSELDGRYYYSFTEQEVLERIKDYNSGKSQYTKKYKPWKLTWSAKVRTDYRSFAQRTIFQFFKKMVP